jgi:thioester reductase-like protein
LASGTEIAVVGIGCRFPDAWTPWQFWHNIDSGVVSMRELSEEQLRAAGHPEELISSPDLVRVATTLPGVADFAAEFFGYRPKEAEVIDPQQRIFLEAAWEALESAGHAARPDGPVVGVFASSYAGTYSAAVFAAKTREAGLAAAIGDLDLTVGGQPDFLSSRTAYKIGLRGPAVSVQTGCSSSLYAVHYATLSLLSGECDIALAGGATVVEPLRGYRREPNGFDSQDGFCRSFDAGCSGTAFSSGVGVVALRRLSDALADGDPVLAVLVGSAVGNEGAQRLGFHASSPGGVADVVSAALRVADVPADLLRYVEAHGTATEVGDQIELLALTEACRRSTARSSYCGLGSVMTNIGHTGPAAGVAGFIKAVHVARTGTLPPHPLFERPREPGLLAESPFFVPRTAQLCADTDRHVLVNSIGVGGTNAAAVLAPPPAPTRAAAAERDVVRLVLSARTRAELDAMAGRLADELQRQELPLADVAHTLRVGRRAFAERRVVTVGTPVSGNGRHSAPNHSRPGGDAQLTGRLCAALRMPRPPAARTNRVTTAIRAIVVTAPTAGVAGVNGHGVDGPAAAGHSVGGYGMDLPGEVLAPLLAALPRHTETVRGPVGAGAGETFQILVGHGEPGPNRHLLPLEWDAGGTARLDEDAIAEAVTAAWLHGVEVDWQALAAGRGRRVPLPTYPFTRRRFWALDRYPGLFAAPGMRASDRSNHEHRDAHSTGCDHTPEATSAGGTDGSLEAQLAGLWRDLFDTDAVGFDDEFGALGGTSLLSVQLVLEIQQRYGVLINAHRAGGSKATVRSIAKMIRGLLGDGAGAAAGGPAAAAGDTPEDDDGPLVDADLQLPLGPVVRTRAPGRDVLLTGATGFLGSHLLHELLTGTNGRVYCLVRAGDEVEAMARLRVAAARFDLPDPDPARVQPVPGDLRDIATVCRRYRDGELAERVGHVMHCAAKIVFTEPYRTLREHNVVPTVALLAWMREHGIADFSYISTLAAAAPALETGRLLETRQQPLDPEVYGYGTSKWVCERLLERAEQDGMRVRVFRPGLIMSASRTGACNDSDLIWFILVSGLAVGAHPADDRLEPFSPVDVLARAVVELAFSPGSVGRAYHLADERLLSIRQLFEQLAELGLPTQPLPPADWQRRVAGRALATGAKILASATLYEIDGEPLKEGAVQARGWLPWLRRRGVSPAVTGELLLRGLRYLAGRNAEVGELLGGLLEPDVLSDLVEVS